MIDLLRIGYNKPLFILPFDHRSSFEEKIFNVEKDLITDSQKQEIISYKKLIYEGFKKAVFEKIPKNNAAILIDEEYGEEILKDARENDFNICLTTEKSKANEFEFEYGDSFKEHIEKYKPKFAKALVRYNVEEDSEKNKRQQEKLKTLSDYCHSKGYLFLLELLVSATKTQLERVENNNLFFDEEKKPRLALLAIDELRAFGVEPDVWKIEGSRKKEVYEELVKKINDQRGKIGIIILGRGENKDLVEEWIITGAKTKGITGFAIGRTIFWQVIQDFKNQKITKDETIDIISKNYQYFYNLFIKKRLS